jgi:hypothetical protein
MKCLSLCGILIERFGNHDPGGGRQKQVKSPWDTLHAGRPWAKALPNNPKRPEELRRMIADFFAGRKVRIISPEKAVTGEEP